LLPGCLAVAGGKVRYELKLFIGAGGFRLHGVEEVVEGHDHVHGQLHLDVNILGVGDSDVRSPESCICLVESGCGIRWPKLRQLHSHGVDCVVGLCRRSRQPQARQGDGDCLLNVLLNCSLKHLLL
jgi:hypothetical protein